jgi:hypothetical protein
VATSDLLALLRTDLGDEDAALFDETTLTRCLHRAALVLGRDLDIAFAIQAGEIVPAPEGVERELLLLLARIHACEVMRSRTSNAFAFSSGDKRVDKSKQPEHWAKLEADLRALYRSRLKEVKPDAALVEDDYFVKPGHIAPVVYEQGVNACPYCQARSALRPCPTCGR